MGCEHMKDFTADLHIHSCLSACAELEMTPARIVERAAGLGLDIIALADHNSARNAEVAVGLGKKAGVLVLPAMEICSREEAHVLALFKGMDDALRMQEEVYRGLGPLGDGHWQVVVDAEDGVLGFERLALIGASDRALSELPGRVRAMGGLAIASHVDREAFSVTSQMGFVPDDVIFDAFEVVEPERARNALMFHPDTPWIASSDAHQLEDVGKRTTVFRMEEASFEELALALRGEGGRGLTPEFG
jgi:PHP family Zn ribbon phosphoesterase